MASNVRASSASSSRLETRPMRSASDSTDNRRAVSVISRSGRSTREVSVQARIPAAATTSTNATDPAVIMRIRACSRRYPASTDASTSTPSTRTSVPGGRSGTAATESDTSRHASHSSTTLTSATSAVASRVTRARRLRARTSGSRGVRRRITLRGGGARPPSPHRAPGTPTRRPCR